MRRFYVGTCPKCGAMSAAMVDDEKTTNRDVGKFTIGVIESGRLLSRLELMEGSELNLSRCRCTAVEAPDATR